MSIFLQHNIDENDVVVIYAKDLFYVWSLIKVGSSTYPPPSDIFAHISIYTKYAQ